MVKLGMIIGDRYEILEKIGTGGMSDVYKAKDQKLNRNVAVKVLKQEFSDNANFVSKFRVEAQAAASLAHPNIVNVYDVGEEEGINYIVMELVEGITLKKYIEKKARLSYKEAMSIAIQVSMGIEAAHNNHIIHRDIKPQNIIISRDGKVKVTDFGIAKAATSNTITSNVMGSVHYTSPEQARGGYSDEKSDIYSLGITMFEMLTGRVPFNGETTVAIAIKHIQEELPSPKEYVPEIPTSVERIVIKCCQKSPDRRYQNMAELIADLKHSLMNPEDDFVVMNDPDVEAGTRAISKGDMEQIKRQASYSEEYVDREESLRLRSETDDLYEDSGEDEGEDYDYNPKMEKLTTVLAILGGVVILLIIVILAIKLLGTGSGSTGESLSSPIVAEETSETDETESSEEEVVMVKVPDVTGITQEDARNQLTKIGLVINVLYEESDMIDTGVVISMALDEAGDTPLESGTELAQGTEVWLTVSAGQAGIEIPDVTGKTEEEAKNTLMQAGFQVNSLKAYSDDVAAGAVITQSPSAGGKAPKNTTVTLTVSMGAETVKITVPNLIGLTEEEATITAIENGLEIGTISYVYDSTEEEGNVCYQSYSSGVQVDQGTKIDIKVSKGVEAVTYKCDISIEAPTMAEAPDYTGGEVHLVLTTDDGQTLVDTTTSNFPYSAVYHGLASSGGTVTMSYTVTSQNDLTVQTESADGTNGDAAEESSVASTTTEEKSFTRRIEFTQE